jgi:pimeloyl-ACP methyl ester carboxylesterase
VTEGVACLREGAASVRGVRIAYQTVGDPDHSALLLIMGLGASLEQWDTELCLMFAERGLFVIRFDNRDVGRSSWIEPTRRMHPIHALISPREGAAYGLDDMADDAFGLLNHLGVEAAHVVGVSLGGQIGQTMALRRPDRVLSLASIMSSTGDRRLLRPQIRTVLSLARPMPRRRDAAVAQMVRMARVVASPGFPFEEERLRAQFAAAYDRGFSRGGVLRQLLATLSAGDRTGAVAAILAPTVVIHGDSDPLLPPAAGRGTAQAIPGARLVLIPGMGHDLPRGAWPRIVGAIAANIARSDAATGVARDA